MGSGDRTQLEFGRSGLWLSTPQLGDLGQPRTQPRDSAPQRARSSVTGTFGKASILPRLSDMHAAKLQISESRLLVH